MSKLLTVAGIASAALGKIGAFTVAMVAPDPDELARAVEWLDLNVAQLAGTGKCHWLIPNTTTTALTADIASYTLSSFLGTDYPDDGILFPLNAYIRDSAGQDTPVQLITRQEYEAIASKTDPGAPDRIYIDRSTNSPTLYVYPVPSVGTYSLRLVFQTYAPDFQGGSPEGAGNVAHGLSAEWQKWMILQTAGDIGSGPVRVLPLAESDRMKLEAQDIYMRLMAYSNREHTTKAPTTEATLF